MLKLGICTLGCKVNQYESNAVAEEISALGAKVCDFSEKCDIYIINTCAVTEESVRKSRQTVRRAIKTNPAAYVIVSGCGAQLCPEKFAEIDGVSFVCGTRNKLEAVEKAHEFMLRATKPAKAQISMTEPDGDIENMSIKSFGRTRAYVKIEDGCDGKCAYCIIPKVRGGIVSKPRRDVIREVNDLARGGCREVVLTGIETSAYNDDLPELISEVDRIEGISRIRLGSLEPSFLRAENFDKMAKAKKLSPHFHVSVQNGSDRILALMRRKYNTRMLRDNLAHIREIMPDVNFSADIIVGFPSETEEDFEKTLELVRDVRFLHVHAFTYSQRPGTEAAGMPDQTDESVKVERSHRLCELSDRIKSEILDKIVADGKSVRVMAETYKSGIVTGHTDNFVEVRVKVGDGFDFVRGDIISAMPTSVENGVLVAIPIK